MPSVPYERFVRELEFRYGRRAKGTWEKMELMLRELGRVLDDSGLPAVATTADLTPLSIERWVTAHPARTRPTAHSLLRSLRSGCRFALAMGYLELDPFRYYSVSSYVADQPDPPARPRHHTREELARVFESLRDRSGLGWKEHRLLALFAMALHAGLRKNEALRLKVCDIDFDEGLVRVLHCRQRGADADQAGRPYAGPRRAPRLKTKEAEAPVPMSDELREILAGWVPRTGSEWLFPTRRGTEPWTGGPPGYKPLDELAAAGRRVGVDGVSFASLRKCLPTHGGYFGLGRNDVMTFLRHTRISTQEHYVERDLENLAARVRPIRYLPSAPPPAEPPGPSASVA